MRGERREVAQVGVGERDQRGREQQSAEDERDDQLHPAGDPQPEPVHRRDQADDPAGGEQLGLRPPPRESATYAAAKPAAVGAPIGIAK